MERDDTPYCESTVRSAITLIGGKWSIPILWELLHGERRFSDLQRRVSGVSQKVLSADLKTLARAGLVERTVTPSVPPQVTYSITSRGMSLEPVFDVLHQWSRSPGGAHPAIVTFLRAEVAHIAVNHPSSAALACSLWPKT